MPIYEYRCSSGHVSDFVGRFENRPGSLPCAKCGSTSTLALSAPAGWVKGSANPVRPTAAPAYAQEAPPLTVEDYACTACDHRIEALVDRAGGEDPDAARACPACLGEMRRCTAPRIDVSLKLYPYFDYALGCEVTSPAHRLAVAKSKGLRPTDGANFDRDLAARDAETEKVTRDYNAYVDMLEHDPAYANFRKSRDQGAYDPNDTVKAELNKPFVIQAPNAPRESA